MMVPAISGCLLLPFHPAAAQSDSLLPELVVLSDRGDHLANGSAIASWDRADLSVAAPRTLDELLARDPAFSLYRRQSAVFGNPTSAGVSLRNVGATAASRTLVLRDGIPQNDPFGGWVYWARYDPRTIDSVRIVPGARATAWGNMSPSGVVQMNSIPPFVRHSSAAISGGGNHSLGTSLQYQSADRENQFSTTLAAFGFHSDGFFAVDQNQRGTIDRKLDISLSGADWRAAWRPAADIIIEPMVSVYQERRGNGTPMSVNSTEATDLAMRVTRNFPDHSWQLLAWHQRRAFDAVFSSVNDDRSAEVLALDQYDVPATGTGGAAIWMWTPEAGWTLTAGADFRFLSGETRERVGTFRNRVAGGRQAFQGIFATVASEPGPTTRIDATARLDAWRINRGVRRESALASGAILRDERPPDRDGVEPSGSVEIRQSLAASIDARLAAGSSFRVPTLNELHRPFRVRNDIVEANPALKPERFHSIDAGVDWRPADALRLELSLFQHWIDDAIANVPVTDPAEIAAIAGALPPGVTLAQRRNVDRASVRGIEARAAWSPREDLYLTVSTARSRTRFTRSGDQPLLAGKPFPQAPEWRATAELGWQATPEIQLFLGCDYGSARFDDALAARRIPAAATVHIGLRHRGERASFHFRIDNLFDEAVQTGLSSDGIRTLAAPRTVWSGIEWEF